MSFDFIPGLDPLSPELEGWRARLEAASFRGVPFWTHSEELEIGRRFALHEYTGRELPYGEDVGKRADVARFDAFVIGPDYDIARNALLEALRRPGPGELILSRYGVFSVLIDRAVAREQSAEGRYSRISIVCVEAGVRIEPATSAATQEDVESAADNAALAILAQFIATTEEAVGWVQENVVSRVGEALQDLDDVILQTVAQGPKAAALQLAAKTLTGEIGLLDPLLDIGLGSEFASMGSDLIDLYLDVGRLEASALERLRLLESLRHHREDEIGAPLGPIFPRPEGVTTPEDVRIDDAHHEALAGLIRRSITVARTIAALEVPLPSLEESRRIRDDVLATLDEEIEAAGGVGEDEAFVALRELRSAFLRDISIRGERLPELVTFTPAVNMSSLLLSQRLYGTGSRADELVERIQPRHPGFIPAGVPLRVPRE